MVAISEQQGIPRKYLHALLTTLRSAELVRSVRGSGGGYVLGRGPEEITLGELVRVLEGPINLAGGAEGEGRLPGSEPTVDEEVWNSLSALIEAKLGEISLALLVERARDRREKKGATPMFYI